MLKDIVTSKNNYVKSLSLEVSVCFLTYELQRLYWITSVTIYKPTILFVCNFIIWDKIWNTQDTPEDGRNGRAEEGQYEYWLFIIVGR